MKSETETTKTVHPPRPEEVRCGCGSLLARIRKEGIELKCRRCKAKSLIPLGSIAGDIRLKWPGVLQGG